MERFAFSGYRKVRIFNLAVPGHTTRDSRLKYAALSDARFDLVLIYEGINDTRANNVPPEIFREDYSHFSWYEAANILSNYHGTASFALPYMLRFLALRVRQRLTQHNYVPAGLPRKAWLQYGAEPRSPMSFERNLTAILDLAKQRGDQVLLITFAIHVPKNYSHEAFQAGQLGYGLHRSPIATWGQPEHVQATVAIHNNIIRRLATQHEGSLFVDQAKLMDGVANYFNDICHFTVDGSVRFVENVMEVLPIK